MEAELPLGISVSEKGEQLAAEQATEGPDGEEKFPSAGDPWGSIGRNPSGGHEAVKMGVLQQVLTPGVQHSEEADAGAEVPWIGRDLQQRLGNGAKQQAIEQAGVLPSQGNKFLGHGEHHVGVGYR
jgi:hypothetical protein